MDPGLAGGGQDGLAGLRRNALGLQLEHVAHQQQVLDATDLLQAPAIEDADPVADVLHVGQQVRREEDRLALALQVQDEVLHFAGADRVQARGRFV